ncbi:MAG: quinone oxidoreductase family protein [Chloroflexota bacterium]
MKAVRVGAYGGPEVLRVEELPVPEPRPGEALVKLAAIGLNFIDIYQRAGLYKNTLPFTAGQEGAGTVAAVGLGVEGVKVGDRVAWASVMGSYAEYATVPVSKLVAVPEGVDLRTAAAVMLQGMTAHYLTRSTYALQSGDTILLHAAAGGVGLLLVQMAKMIGVHVIGTAGTREKAELARSFGADEVILYTEQDFYAEVRRLTDGKGVQVVYDSVGKATFMKSLDCLRPRGYMVLFGQSSGPAPAIEPTLLNVKGSLYLTRPSLAAYTVTREELLWRSGDVLKWVADGKLKVRIGQEFPLVQAAEAQRTQESRVTTGKTLLIP